MHLHVAPHPSVRETPTGFGWGDCVGCLRDTCEWSPRHFWVMLEVVETLLLRARHLRDGNETLLVNAPRSGDYGDNLGVLRGSCERSARRFWHIPGHLGTGETLSGFG